MDITSLIVEAVSGAVGGNVAGAAMKEKSLGPVGNSIAGIVRHDPANGDGLRCDRWWRNGSSKYPCQRRRWRGWRRDPHDCRWYHQEHDGQEIATA
jgi:hypothetical protein